jgi:hypothetical protein
VRAPALQEAARSIRRVVGIAALALRASLRTKVVSALLVLLAACVLLLPGVIKGDGTPAGELHILLTYTLGFSFGILCLATLWAACALFAAEIDSQRMQVSAVKPVRAVEFWLGKWCALLILDASLLAAVYAGVYAQVAWHARRGGWQAEDRPVSRSVARPLLPTLQAEARQTYELMRQQNALPNGLSEKEVLRALAEKANERYDVVSPGDQVRWRFRLARPLAAGEPVTVRVKFDTEYSTREQVTGACRLSAAAHADRSVEVKLDDFTQNEIEFAVDTRAFVQRPEVGGRSGGADEFRDFELTFLHTGDPKKAPPLMLRFRRDVVLLTPGGLFETNLVRSALLHGCVLALLAAFGLTLSACFSLPVAAFVATVLLVLSLVGNAVVAVTTEEDSKVWWNRAGIWVSRGVYEVTRHTLKGEPLTALTRGERIEGRALAESLLWNVALLPLALAALGCAALRSRELADGD